MTILWHAASLTGNLSSKNGPSLRHTSIKRCCIWSRTSLAKPFEAMLLGLNLDE